MRMFFNDINVFQDRARIGRRIYPARFPLHSTPAPLPCHLSYPSEQMRMKWKS